MATKTDSKPTELKAQHTPGPWSVKQGSDERDFIVAEQSGNTVCEPNTELFNDWPELDPSVRHISVDEAKANARLIAAAPDMFDTLKALWLLLPSVIDPGVERRLRELVDTAIAKAEGR